MIKININSTDWFKEKVRIYHGDKVEILSEYIGSVNKIDIVYHCEKHGDTYSTINAKNICKSYFLPCKKCQSENKSKSAINKKINDKQYYYNRLKEYCESRGGKLISEKWTTAKDIYAFKCSNLEHPVFYTTADALYSGKHWCPYCCGRKGNFEEQIKDIINNKDGKLLSNYKNASTYVTVKCNKHNYTWDILPNNIKKNRWCPICSMCFSEKVVWDYLINNECNIKIQYSFDDLTGINNEKLKYDFAIFNKNNELLYLLEVDDEEHRYNPKKSERRIKSRQYDIAKNEYCKINGINLYRMEVPFKSGIKHRWKYEDYYNYIHTELKDIIILSKQ